jgi:hypothetical protein
MLHVLEAGKTAWSGNTVASLWSGGQLVGGTGNSNLGYEPEA